MKEDGDFSDERELEAVGKRATSTRHLLEREMEETASPDIVRRLMAMQRKGASIVEIRGAYEALDLKERRWVLPRTTDEERQALNVSHTNDSYEAYRALYSRTRDDVFVRERLRDVDEGTRAAWLEADAMERDLGMRPQDIASEFRSRVSDSDWTKMEALREVIDEDDIAAGLERIADPEEIQRLFYNFCSGVDLETRAERSRDFVPLKPPAPPKEVLIQRGFLERAAHRDRLKPAAKKQEEPRASLGDATVAEHVASRLGAPVREAEAALEHSAREYARLAAEPTAEGLFAALTKATQMSSNSRTLVDATRTAALAAPCPVLSRTLVDFMIEIYEMRASLKEGEDEGALRRKVVEHMRLNGKGFLEHMKGCAEKIDALLESNNNHPRSSPDSIHAALYAHYRCPPAN